MRIKGTAMKKIIIPLILIFLGTFSQIIQAQTEIDPNFIVLTMQTFGPPGSGSTIPAGVKLIESANQAIAISALPAEGFQFSSWTVKGRGQFEDSRSASTNVTLTGNAVVTAIFIPLENPVTATLTVSGDGNGTVTPNEPVTLSVGDVQNIIAVPAAGYKFVYWSVEGPAFVDNCYTSSANVIANGPAIVTAHFSKDGDVVELEIKASEGGTVQDPGIYYVVKGDMRPINALPLPDYIFTGWQVEGLSVIKSEYAPETEITLYEKTTVLASFEQFTCPFSHKGRKISIQTNDFSGESGSYISNCDKVTVTNLPMCIGPANFNPNTDTLRVIVDGNTFVINKGNGLFRQFTSGYKYNSFSRVPRLNLTLDFIKGVWSFTGTKVELATIDNSNGVDVILQTGSDFNGKNYNMDESIRWSFNNLKNPASLLPSGGTEMEAFKLTSASSTIRNSKDLKDRLAVSNAVLQLPVDADININELDVTLTLGGEAIIIPKGQFVKKQNGQYTYNNKVQKLQIKIDLKKHRWSMSMSGFNGWGKLDPLKSINVYLTIGNYQSGQAISPNIKRTLTYDYSKIYWSSTPPKK